MSDGVKFKIDTSQLEKKFQNTLDFTKNFKPFFQSILGDGPSSSPDTIRGGIHYSFENSVDPAGKGFQPLNEIYKKWKDKNFSPDLPILMRSQWLYDSLVHTNDDTVLQMSNKLLTFGTKVPYARVQFSGFKENNLPARNVMGWRKNQIKVIQLKFRQYIVDAFNLKATRG